ncbi:MAG: NAD(P)/FAD-dependent oxidoreductase [Planctomycetota bacterium]
MRIGISGCGIAGTTVGFLLAEQGHSVTIFEQAAVCRPVGAGIMLQTSGQNVLGALGMLDDLAPVSQRLSGMTAELVSGKRLIKLDFSRLTPDTHALGVHRGRLFEMLLSRCHESGVELRNGVRVTKFDPAQRAVVSETGDRFDGFDFLIAADGSRSVLRQASSIRARVKEYGWGALWCTGECDFQPGELHQVVDGTRRLLGLLPIGLGQSSFFWGLRASDYETLVASDFDAWKSEAIEMCRHAESILQSVNGFDDLTFGTYRNVALDRWYDAGVIFLGDAAHATSPHLGQGVNLALEDAVCFATSLEASNDFESACDLFSRKRTRKLRYYQRLTRALTPFFQSDGTLKAIPRNLFLPWFPHLPFVGRQMLRTLSGCKNGWLG